MTERSPIVKLVTTRVQYLKTILDNPSLSKGTPSYSTISEHAAEELIAQLQNGTALRPKEAVDVMEAIGTPGVFTDHDRERIIGCVGNSLLDIEVQDTTPTTPCTVIVVRPGGRSHPRKQTMEHIENYITATAWDQMARGAEHQDVLGSVGKLLVDLGIMHPSEKLFGQIVALLRYCHLGPLPPTMQLLHEVEAEYRAHRGNTESRGGTGYVPLAGRRKDVGLKRLHVRAEDRNPRRDHVGIPQGGVRADVQGDRGSQA